MIDDKKIEAAKEEIYEDRFLLNGEEIVFDNDAKEEMFNKEDIKEAIGLGSKWAINELLNGLWNPVSEKPKNLEYIVFTTTMFGEVYLFTKQVDNTQDWKTIVETHGIEQWIYRDDIVSLIFKEVKE